MRVTFHLICALTASWSVLAQSPVMLRTFNNPTPETGDHFGIGIAALGSDRVLIGAPNYLGNPWPPTNAAAVHLFRTNGTLLTTITQPAAVGGEFGTGIATLGNDRIVIGSLYGMSVCLFTTNGDLVTTITDSQALGPAAAAFGNDKLLIGASYANENPDTWEVYGAAYLYSTNGTRLTTFYNPNPGTIRGLGASVTAFGSDRVLVSCSSEWPGGEAAFLFSTNGTLLMTFTNPPPVSPYDYGHPVIAVGTDRVLVGAPGYHTNVGAVHLFNTNGTLLLTITNPTPAAEDYFGTQIAALGNDRVVIGAFNDHTTAPYAGSAYVFSLNGSLLATINNPAPSAGASFGYRVAAFGNEGVFIGAPWASGVGSAYLFRIPAPSVAPSIRIQRTLTNTAVSWPSNATGFVLQQNTNGLATMNWSNVTGGIQTIDSNKTVIINATNGSRFYRLISP